MIKKINAFILLVIVSTSIANATIWRVNNNTGISADFTTIQAAHDGATAGDTIYIEGSSVNYGGFTSTKQLYIFGPGYFLAENDSTQANYGMAEITGIVNINAGSEGSLYTGCFFSDNLAIKASNVTVKRNYFFYRGITISNSASNIIITQNYIRQNYSLSSYAGVRVQTGSTNIIIQNNYLEHTNLSNSSYCVLTVEGSSTAQITNNTILGHTNIANSSMSNNIMRDGTLTQLSCSFNNNIGNSTQFGTLNGNQENVDMLSVFDSTKTSTDRKFELIAGSSAIGAGMTGEDCGMYGGIDPYVPSGIPSIPSIFFFQAPSSGSETNGLPVTIRAKSNR